MGFYSGPIPFVHQTKKFTFRPLMPKYAELDFEALMTTKTILRQWSNSPWPQDDFTLEANRTDLQRHYDEFQNDKAYAYTVLNPEESRVEGCLYINPLSPIMQRFNATVETLSQVAPDEAHIGFWIRGDRLADETHLLRDILNWLDDAWQFPQITFFTFDTSSRQSKLFESLEMCLRFRLAQTGGVNLLLYHRV